MVRSLPLRVAPHPGEGLDSYLETLAARHHATWGSLLIATGLTRHTSGQRAVPSWLRTLPTECAHDLHTSCAVDATLLQSMTLAALLDPAGETRCTPASLASQCLLPARSRFCPACLADTAGRWQLWWRLRWAFLCPTHRCLLADTCPRCSRWQRTGPHPRGLVPTPTRCSRATDTLHGLALPRCGADLTAPRPTHLAGKAVVAAQLRILTVYRDGCASFGVYGAHPVSAAQFTAELSDLAARILCSPTTEAAARLLPPDLRATYRQCVTDGSSHPWHTATPGPRAADTAVAALVAMHALTVADAAVAGASPRPRASPPRRLALTVVDSA
ncbi:hypothetical protein BH10ACT9_BH10ACT9_46190 [soil metagenome]